MATFLVTSRMDPALAARVEASVRGKRFDPTKRKPRGLVAFARLAGVLVVVAIVSGVVQHRQRQKRDLEATRASLLAKVNDEAAPVSAANKTFVARATPWLLAAGKSYEGDVTAPELKTAADFDALLKKPTVYVRGPVAAFASTEAIADAAATSYKDAFLYCLVDPPTASTEKAMLTKVQTAHSGKTEAQTSSVRRLNEALLGLPFFEPAFAAAVTNAETVDDLGKLRRELERAPLERARKALASSLLVTVVDEPNDPKGTTELDGEHLHWVRVTIVDLGPGSEGSATAKVVLRRRKQVDPTWISEGRRPQYAGGLDACKLAYELRTP